MKVSGPLTEAFFALVRSGLVERLLADSELTPVLALTSSDWFSMEELAREQAVSGLIYRAVTHLPRTVAVPGDVVLTLMARAEETAIDNRQKAAVTARLLERFAQKGLSPSILKGSTVAAFYLHPELRESGDIDLFVPKDQFARAQACMPGASRASDGSIHGREDDVDIDLHDRYFDLHVPASRLPVIGTPEATLLMLSSHILKHAIGPGVGVRQLCDMAMASRALAGNYDPSALKTVFKRTGTLRWNRLLYSFLAEWLDMPDPVFDRDHVSTAPLLRIIMEGGNFGHHAAARKSALGAGDRRRKVNTFFRFLHRLPFSLRYAPLETLATLWTLFRGNI